MTPEQFVYWLQGFSEVNGDRPIDKDQWTIIQDHLKTVFRKETPDRSKEVSEIKLKDIMDKMDNANKIPVPLWQPKIADDLNFPTTIC